MTPTVTTEFSCTYTLPGFEPRQGRMSVLWEMDAPMQLTVDFEACDGQMTEWLLSRDMFADCMLNAPGPQFGGGDAVLDRGMATFHLSLSSTEGEAGIIFPIFPMIPFMTQTLSHAPRGAQEFELIEAELDAFVESALNGETRSSSEGTE